MVGHEKEGITCRVYDPEGVDSRLAIEERDGFA